MLGSLSSFASAQDDNGEALSRWNGENALALSPPGLPRPRMTHRVYLVEDHPVVRQAFASLIDASDDLHVVGSAASASDALAALPGLDVDAAVVDVSLGGPRGAANGIDLVAELHRLWPALRVLVVSGHDETVYAERAMRAGARGYLMKGSAGPNLLPAIRRVLAGDVALSDRMLGLLPEALCAPLPAL